MRYFAGLFDAEGNVMLNTLGGFAIATEMANQKITEMFKDSFGGNIYTRQRNGNKRTWCWKISSNEEVKNFLYSILPYSQVKRSQLLLLNQYLAHRREERARLRKGFIANISECKKPQTRHLRFVQIPTSEPVDDHFFEWFAGFVDGDGNFTLYESKRQFITQISVSNIVPEVIKLIKSRIDGSICINKKSKNPLWKWTCLQNITIHLCESLNPYLRIKKEQCEIVLEYHKTKQMWNYSDPYRVFVRDLILKMKHLNSL